MAEFGPAQAEGAKRKRGGFGTGVVASPGKGNLAGQLGGGPPRPVDDPGQWAHRFAPRPKRCPDGCEFVGNHVHDPSGAVHRVDALGRWAAKPLAEDGAP